MRSTPFRHAFRTFTILAAGVIAGGCEGIDLAGAERTKLGFTVPPTNAEGAQVMTPAIQVAVQDFLGNTMTVATDSVTVGLGANPGAGTLSGTLTVAATQGIATFSDLRINNLGSYTLVASAAGHSGATSAPFVVFGLTLRFATVSAGGEHTCGVTPAGAAYCWGGNDAGQLGDGTTTNRLTPVAVAGGVSFASVSAGDRHTCGVTATGAAYCWGYNEYGQLGDGTTTNRSSLVLVAGGVSFAAVSAGPVSTCGVTAATAAYCWGWNYYGQLGDGTTTDRSSPVLVAGGVAFAAVSAGSLHSCGVTATGAAYCWGDNRSGQLGAGDTTDRASPELVAGGMRFTAVGAGFLHTCGITATGAAYCWGYGVYGDENTPAWWSPLLMAGGNLTTVSAGHYYTCGITAAGAASCWGRRDGHLGAGPGLVAGAMSFAAVSAGRGEHACAVTAAGIAFCWGDNFFGQLGDGTRTSRTRASPGRVLQ